MTDRAMIVRRVARIALVVVTLLFAAWLVLFITKGRFLRSTFESMASARLHRTVKVAGEFNLYFAPINVAFRADGLSVGNVPWAAQTDFLDAHHVALTLRTLPLLWGVHRIAVADIDGAQLDLQWDAAHQRNTWTFDAPGTRPTPFEMPEIEQGSITQTRVRYADPAAQIAFVADIHPVTTTASHIDQAVGFSGSGSLRHKPVRLTGRVDQPDRMIAQVSSKVVLHAVADDTTLDLTGTMPGITAILYGHYQLAARGRNMADLFDFIGVVGVPTRKYHVVAALDRDHDDWVFSGIKGVFGDSDLAGRLAIGMRDDRLHLGGDLRTRSLDVLDAAPFIGYDPARIDQLGAKGLITQVNGHPRLLPDAPLRAAALRTFDADVHYKVGALVAKTVPVTDIDLPVKLDHGVLTMKPVAATVASGRMDGGFVLDTRPAQVVTDYQIRLHPTPMGKLLSRFGVEEAGTNGTISARVALHGVGNSVRDSLGHADGRMVAIIPKGTMWARNIQLAELDIGTFIQRMFQKKLKDPVEINCGVVGFTVRDGVSAADPILIDTRKNVIAGRGQFSFRDESVDLQVRAKAKTFSLFSLQSPVGVGGYLAAPRLKVVSPQLLTRGGAAVALGLVASPVAALIAFIDPGDGKAAACGPVLAGASAVAQRTTKGQPRNDLGKK